MILTGNAEQKTAINAVNQGHIFRFLAKPCPMQEIAHALKAAVEQYRLVTAEKELLGKTLKGSVKLLMDILAMVNPAIFSSTLRQTALTKALASRLSLNDASQFELATMFSSIGKLALPREIVEKIALNSPLSAEEARSWIDHPQAAKKLLKNIPRLEAISESVAYQMKEYDGGGSPTDTLKGQEIPLGARILKVVLDYDALIQQGQSETEALDTMALESQKYDPEILKALKEHLNRPPPTEDVISIFFKDLKPGMVLAKPVIDQAGRVLLRSGEEVTVFALVSLRNFDASVKILEPLTVLNNA